ncbi:MAG: hypothetical protein HN842_09905 [Gammaproteobacteria bacterium]|jgi:TolB-like protein|nr:hypothetical protein [Gammaproteobacteria bacterium]MBT7308520.1 hypothetical protein [Gammaproteobacteria bacterium]
MKKTLTTLISAGVLLCSTASATPLSDFAGVRSGVTEPYQQNPMVSIPGELNEVSRFLVDQLTQNRDMENMRDNPIAVASLVELEDFKSTNKLGLWLSENMMHELQIRGFKTIDFKTMPSIQVSKEGDFVMSKNLSELRGKYNINHVISGTYTEYPNGIMINVRLVDMATSVITSSAQAHISKGYYLKMLNGINGSTRRKPVDQHEVELVDGNNLLP